MQIVLLIYIVIIVLFIFFESTQTVRFWWKNRLKKLVFLLDYKYAVATLIFHLVYFTLLFVEIYEFWEDYRLWGNENFPYIIYTIPIMFILSRMMLDEGFFAYSDEFLYGRCIDGDLSKIRSISTRKSKIMNRIKVDLDIYDNRKKKYKKIIIRTSWDAYEKFAEKIKDLGMLA